MATYMNRVFGEDAIRGKVTDGDGTPAKLELCVSIGEFEMGQTLLEIHTEKTYEMIVLDFTAAHALKMALDDALSMHTEDMLSSG
jgi:hypothetical protein